MKLEDIKNKLKGMAKSGGGEKKDMFWSPTDKHVIRLLPSSHGEDPLVELKFHYNIGKHKMILCPKCNFGEECVICDFVEVLWSWTDENGNKKSQEVKKAHMDEMNAVKAKSRWGAWVVERPTDKTSANLVPKLWNFSDTVAKQLLEMCMNEDLAELTGQEGTDILTNPMMAVDISVDYKQANNADGKGNDKRFPETKLSPKIKVSKLASSPEEVKRILESTQAIASVNKRFTSQEVEQAYREYCNERATEDSGEATGVEYTAAAVAANSSEKPVLTKSDLEDALSKM